MTSETQKNVYAAVWPWRKAGTAVAAKGMPRQAKALLQAAFMLLIAYLLRRFLHHVVMSYVVCTLAGIVLVGGLFVPPVFDAIERFGKMLGRGAAVGLTWGLLVPFYYLCFVPARIVLLLKRKDPMNRQFPTDATSYWEARPPVKLEQYRKQH